MTPRTLLESFGLRLPCKNLFDGNRKRRTQYHHHSLQSVICKNRWKLNFLLQIYWKWLSETLKMNKLSPPQVCGNRIRFTHRMDTPFVSADTQGPKDVFQSKFWIWKSFAKFFRALQLTASRLLEGNFWCFPSDFDENSSKSWKNRHLRTSEWLKMNSCDFQ